MLYLQATAGRKLWVGAGSDARVETTAGLLAAASASAVDGVEEMLRDVQAVQRAHSARAVLHHQVNEPPPQVHHLAGPLSLSLPAAREGCDQERRRDQAYADIPGQVRSVSFIEP